MATQRYISTSFWDDAWIRSLDPAEKFVYLYLMTNPLTNIAGVYEITTDRICFDTGYNKDTVDKILIRYQKAAKVYRHGNYIIIPSWPKHQKWEKRSKIEAGIVAILKNMTPDLLGYLIKCGYSYPIDTLSIPYLYVQNYSDSEFDSDLDIDIDTEVKDFSFPEIKSENKKEEVKPLDQRIMEYIELWNSLGLPEYRRTLFNIPDLHEARQGVDNYSHQEVIDSIKAYAEVNKNQIKYEPFPLYTTCIKFLIKGVDSYFPGAEPLTRCLRDKSDLIKKQKADTRKKWVAICSGCGERYPASGAVCPKCGATERTLTENKQAVQA